MGMLGHQDPTTPPHTTRFNRTVNDISQEEQNAIITDYKARMPPKSLIAKYHIDRLTLRSILIRAEVELIDHRYKPLSEETKAEIRRLYEEGASMASLARTFKRCDTTIRKELVAMGVELRKPVKGGYLHRPDGARVNDPKDVETAIRMYSKGLSLRQIRQRTGLSKTRLIEALEDAGMMEEATKARNLRLRRATPEMIKEAVEMYEAGVAVEDILSSCGVGAVKLYAGLDAYGVPRRGKRPCTLNDAQKAELVRRYAEGASVAGVAKRFNVCTATAIKCIKAAPDVEYRGRVSHNHLALQQDASLQLRCRKAYESGASLGEVAKMVGCSRETIRKVLVAMGVDTSSSRATPKKTELRERALKLYQEGFSVTRVRAICGIGSSALYSALKEAGVPMRSRARNDHYTRLRDAQREQLAQDYKDGASGRELMDKYKISLRTVMNIVREKGVAWEGTRLWKDKLRRAGYFAYSE